jgi:uncharacterized protein YecT (DUF1311 family)
MSLSEAHMSLNWNAWSAVVYFLIVERTESIGNGMKITQLICVVALFLLPLVCGASGSQDIKSRSPSGITSTFFTCTDKAGSDAIAIAACMTSERKFQDARLNRTYKELLGTLNGKANDELVTAEKAWVVFKVKDATFENLLYGDEEVDNLQQSENEIFRICERANVLDRYLDLANRRVFLPLNKTTKVGIV